jgi:hypothetical protein
MRHRPEREFERERAAERRGEQRLEKLERESVERVQFRLSLAGGRRRGGGAELKRQRDGESRD